MVLCSFFVFFVYRLNMAVGVVLMVHQPLKPPPSDTKGLPRPDPALSSTLHQLSNPRKHPATSEDWIQLSQRLVITVILSAKEHHLPFISTKLYCLTPEAYVTMEWSGVEILQNVIIYTEYNFRYGDILILTAGFLVFRLTNQLANCQLALTGGLSLDALFNSSVT